MTGKSLLRCALSGLYFILGCAIFRSIRFRSPYILIRSLIVKKTTLLQSVTSSTLIRWNLEQDCRSLVRCSLMCGKDKNLNKKNRTRQKKYVIHLHTLLQTGYLGRVLLLNSPLQYQRRTARLILPSIFLCQNFVKKMNVVLVLIMRMFLRDTL